MTPIAHFRQHDSMQKNTHRHHFDQGVDQPSWLVRILPYVEQNSFYTNWDLSKSYSDHPEELTTMGVEIFCCPSRRTISEAQAPPGTKEVLVTAPCGCGGWIEIEVLGGATGDYAGNHGDLSPGSIGAASDYYYGGNGTGVIISSRAQELPSGRPSLD